MHVWVVEFKTIHGRWIFWDAYPTRKRAQSSVTLYVTTGKPRRNYRIRKYVPAQKDGQA